MGEGGTKEEKIWKRDALLTTMTDSDRKATKISLDRQRLAKTVITCKIKHLQKML